MKHVFLETNWLYDIAAPGVLRKAAALQLLDDARAGAITIHLPSICVGEARRAIARKCQPRSQDLREYRRWAAEKGHLTGEESQAAARFLEHYDRAILADLRGVSTRLREIALAPGVHTFALDERMLEQAVDLEVTHQLNLKPFDESILAAVLVRAKALGAAGEEDVCFCDLDGDLKPWDKNGPKQQLQRLYDAAHVWVYGNYLMTSPPRPHGWPRS